MKGEKLVVDFRATLERSRWRTILPSTMVCQGPMQQRYKTDQEDSPYVNRSKGCVWHFVNVAECQKAWAKDKYEVHAVASAAQWAGTSMYRI